MEDCKPIRFTIMLLNLDGLLMKASKICQEGERGGLRWKEPSHRLRISPAAPNDSIDCAPSCGCRHYALWCQCKPSYTSKERSSLARRCLASFTGLRKCWIFVVCLYTVLTVLLDSNLPMRTVKPRI